MAREPRTPPSTGRGPHIREPHSGALGITEYTQSGRYHPMELIVRPYADVLAVPHEPREPEVPELVRPEAFIEWGAPMDFTVEAFRQEAWGVGVDMEDDEPPERKRYTFSEEGRSTSDYRLVGENDPESYLILRVAGQVAFNGPGGDQFRLVFKDAPPPNATRVGKGQTPPAPPTLENIPGSGGAV